MRWRPQVLQFWDGVNIYDKMLFPKPPLMPITLYPLMVLPTVAGAMCWFAIKVAMTTAALMMCFRFVQPRDGLYPPMFRSLVLLLSLAADPGRPAPRQQQPADPLPDRLDALRLAARLRHRRRPAPGAGDDLQGYAGPVLPLLRLQAVVANRAGGMLGMGIFLLIVPSLVIGPHFNGECLGMWWHRMVMPFVAEGRPARRSQPVDRRRVLPAAHRRTPRSGPLRHSSRRELVSLPPGWSAT